MTTPSLTERLAIRRHQRMAEKASKETMAERRARLLAACDSDLAEMNALLGPDPDDHVPAA